MELLEIKFSNRKNKKYVAVFLLDNEKIQNVHFGDSRYLDYTQHHNVLRKARYTWRHKKEVNQPPNTPGALSLGILWGDSTDINKNIQNYIKKYDL